jgi:hypothetical protein
MFAGNFKAQFSALAAHGTLSIRTLIRGADYSVQHMEPFQTILVALDCNAAPF